MLLLLSVVAMSCAGTATAAAAAPASVAPIASVSPSAGESVGVGQPITVRYAAPVADRPAAERSLRLPAAAGPGEVTWPDSRTMRWTPQQLWPAHHAVTYSVGGLTTNFTTRSAVVGVADLSAHTFTVSVDDQVLREMPASMGKPGFATPIGNFTALEKQKSVVMDSRTIGIPLNSPNGYKLTVQDAVRVTWGGVYVHSAPWSVGSQGSANVSHGCINLSPDNAAWYYDMVNIGDPIIVRA
ncbi:L,D-transpeptidase [Mycobacterium sp. MYCO198283]|uniref:L,D-transpeptidase n=1 Tax=Mycobacterium sp. MYCO198283 TaxID=2883505 RepID=UPI0027DFAC4F|nr:L,D-transpeptidase [Mycobacterium sp. MYCO198283]